MLFGNSWYFSVWSLDTAGGFNWGFHLPKRFWSCWTWPFQQTMCWKTCCWWREHPAFYHCKFWRRYGTGCVKAPCAWQTSSRWHDGRLANFMTFFLGEAKLYSTWNGSYMFHVHRFLVRITRVQVANSQVHRPGSRSLAWTTDAKVAYVLLWCCRLCYGRSGQDSIVK